jgi:hypothetical protein
MAEREEFGARRYVYPGSGNNTPLQIVRWTEQRDSIAFAASTLRVEIPENAAIVEFTATENCYVNFGDVTVVASSTIASAGSRLFLAGVQVIPIPLDPSTDEPYTHVAAIQHTVAGILQVEKVA